MKKITEISERLTQILEYAATTPNNFAKILGYTRSQSVYDILNGKCAPSYDFFRRFVLSEYSEVYSLEWLITGQGEIVQKWVARLMPEQQLDIIERINHGVTISDIKATFKNESGGTDPLLLSQLMQMIREKDALIREQAEELGQLRERLTRQGGNADAADNTPAARAV